MKSILILLSLLFAYQLSGQDPLLQETDSALEGAATKITQEYNDQLALDAKQYILFEQKVEEFLIREETIQENFKGEDKLDKLYKLRKAESLEMRNILTKPQFDLYKRIKQQIQPLAKVNTDKKKGLKNK